MKLRTALYDGHTELVTQEELEAASTFVGATVGGSAGDLLISDGVGNADAFTAGAGEVVFVDANGHAATSGDFKFDDTAKNVLIRTSVVGSPFAAGQILVGSTANYESALTLTDDGSLSLLGASSSGLSVDAAGVTSLAGTVSINGGDVLPAFNDTQNLGGVDAFANPLNWHSLKIGASAFTFIEAVAGTLQLGDSKLLWVNDAATNPDTLGLFVATDDPDTDFPADIRGALNVLSATGRGIVSASEPWTLEANDALTPVNAIIGGGLVAAGYFKNQDVTGNADLIQLLFSSAESVTRRAWGTFEFQNSGDDTGDAWFGFNFDPSHGNTDIFKLNSDGSFDAPSYKVGGTPGLVTFSGAVTNLTVVNGIVTAAS